MDNIVVMFRPYDPDARPRLRFLDDCETVHRFFAQASMAYVFPPEGRVRSGSKVLSASLSGFGGLVQEEVFVLEDDEEDFNVLIEALMARDWVGEAGVLRGAGLLQVRDSSQGTN